MKTYVERFKAWLEQKTEERKIPAELQLNSEPGVAHKIAISVRDFLGLLTARILFYSAQIGGSVVSFFKYSRFSLGDAFRKQEVFSLVMIATILSAGFFSLLFFEMNPHRAVARVFEKVPPPKTFVSPFQEMEVTAKSAFVWDVREGRSLFEKNADRIMPLASVTKIMMALTAADLLPKTAVITIRPEFLEEEGDAGLLLDESWRFEDLLEYSLIVSSNDGANAIAAVAGSINGLPYEMGKAEFIRKMNEKAKKIGLLQTTFTNETGLDTGPDSSGGNGTAKDMATLFEYALRHYPEILEATKYGRIHVTSLSNIPHSGWNTNQDVNKIPGIMASKTGYTDLSGGNLVVVFNAGVNRPIIVSVLGSTYEGRFEDVKRLAEAALEHLSLEGEASSTLANKDNKDNEDNSSTNN